MKKLLCHISIFIFLVSACDLRDEIDPSPRVNFEALWQIIDEQYCFFEYKGIDWDTIYEEYSSGIDEVKSESDLFQLFAGMLDNLQDGHVNLFAGFRTYSYDGWYAGHPTNFNWGVILDRYLNYRTMDDYEDIYYTRISDGQVGYLYYGSFSESILETDLDKIFTEFQNCKGLILDVRNNGGGSLTNSDRLASRFTDEKVLCAYIQHKQSKKRNDFSAPYPIYLHPSHAIKWSRPVIILTNRRCYSATNNFICKMKVLPQVVMLGDLTGGGSGFPFNSELPNGWGVRFSTSPILDVNKQHTEFGIIPDYLVSLDNSDVKDDKDTLIEEAIRLILQGNL